VVSDKQKGRLFGGPLIADVAWIEWAYPSPPAIAEPRADASVLGHVPHSP
jgi:hypothetical protein